MRTHIKYSCISLFARSRIFFGYISFINILSFACATDDIAAYIVICRGATPLPVHRTLYFCYHLYRHVTKFRNDGFLFTYMKELSKLDKDILRWTKYSACAHFVQFRCQLPCRKTFVPIFELVRRRHRPILLIGPLYECTPLNIRWHKLLFIACPTPTPTAYYM